MGRYAGGLVGTFSYPASFTMKDNVVELCSAKVSVNTLGIGRFIVGLAGEAKNILFDRCYSKKEIAASLSSVMQAGGFTSSVWDFSSVASLGYPTLIDNPE